MLSLLDNTPAIEDQNTIAVFDGTQAVSDDEAGTILKHFEDSLLYKHLTGLIDVSRCLVEDQNRGIAEQHAGEGYELSFAHAEIGASILKLAVETTR